MNARPNILFLMSDEHRADVAGFAGNTVVRTPVLDELARTGVVFHNAYTPSPICIPGRQCMMSGLLPRSCGCLRYGEDLAPNSMTFARRFAEYGYDAVCCGKLHHMGADQMQGWTHRPAGDLDVADQFRSPRQGDEYARQSYPRQKWSNVKEIQRAGPGRGPCQVLDARWTQAAIDEIDAYFVNPWYDRPRAHRPLLLKLSLLQPHYPFVCDEETFAYYLNRVPVFDEPLPFEHPRLSQGREVALGKDVSEREARRATAAYYGMVETIDRHFGRVLEALRHAGQDLDDWIILYTSDHGDMLGEHGIWEKTHFFEGSVRVPLIVRWPRGLGGGRAVHQNVSLCDLFATLCDLAGIPAPAGLDSRSLAGLLRGGDPLWDNEVVSQLRDSMMIKRDHLKYFRLGPDEPEVLFDLAKDPKEAVNRIGDGAYAEATEAFRRRWRQLTSAVGPAATP